MTQLDLQNPNFISITADIVSSFVANNSVQQAELSSVIASVHAALQGLTRPKQAEAEKPRQPAIPVRKSVTPDFLISLEDGKKYKSLKRHLSKMRLTPEDYRAKWGLPSDYPMVAPNYALRRSELAKSLGLGQRRRQAAAKAIAVSNETDSAPTEAAKPKRRAPAKKKVGK